MALSRLVGLIVFVIDGGVRVVGMGCRSRLPKLVKLRLYAKPYLNAPSNEERLIFTKGGELCERAEVKKQGARLVKKFVHDVESWKIGAWCYDSRHVDSFRGVPFLFILRF